MATGDWKIISISRKKNGKLEIGRDKDTALNIKHIISLCDYIKRIFFLFYSRVW